MLFTKMIKKIVTGALLTTFIIGHMGEICVYAAEGDGSLSENAAEEALLENSIDEEEGLSDDQVVTGDETISEDNAGSEKASDSENAAVSEDDTVLEENTVSGNDTVSDDNAISQNDILLDGDREANKASEEKSSEDMSDDDEDFISLPYSYETDDFSIAIRKTNSWPGGYQGEIILENISDKTVKDWSVSFISKDDLSSVWNAVCETKDDHICLTGESYNLVIEPGESVTIGFQASGESGSIKDVNVEFVFDIDNELGDPEEIISTEPYIFEYDGYTVSYKVTSHWSENCNVSVTVTNTSDEKIHNWNLTFVSDDEIVDPYNAKIIGEGSGNGKWIFKNAGYNQDISAGGSVEFGFQVHFGKRLDIPKSFYISSGDVDVPKSDYAIENIITASWDTGYTGALCVDNLRDEDIEDWIMTVQADDEFSNVWNAGLKKLGENLYEIECPDYDQNISVGERDAIGYSMTLLCEEPSEDSVIVMGLKERKMKAATIPPLIEWANMADYDEDQIPDEVEDIIGTKKMDPDSDKDGLPDGYELLILANDPLNIDSDNDGINDADEDSDEDGLTDLVEYNMGLSAVSYDSDFDRISDGREINELGTKPLARDSDGDGLDDGDEIAIGTDPNLDHTFGYPDADYISEQSVDEESSALASVNKEDSEYKLSLSASASGYLKNIDVRKSSYYSIANDSITVGDPVDISYPTGTIDDLTVRFRLGDAVVNQAAGEGLKNYCIARFYNEANVCLPVKTEYDYSTNTVFIENADCGSYCVMDIGKWLGSIDISEDNSENETLSENGGVITAVTPETNGDRAYFNGHTYEVIKVAVPWIEAKAYCEKIGGHLATINTEEEQRFIEESFLTGSGNTYWLGGYAPETVQSFEWITGEEFSFTNWDPGEPNLEIEKALHMYDYSNSRFGKWNNCPEKDYIYFICEWEYEINPNSYSFSEMYEAMGWEKFPNDFGNIDSSSDRDYDQDNAKDVDEIDFEVIHSVTGGIDRALSIEDFYYSIIGNKEDYEWLLENHSNYASIIQKVGIVPVKSVPFNADSEDDGYNDGEDPRPFENDIEVITLDSEYLSVDTSTSTIWKDPDYRWKNSSNPSKDYISYGGNQMWFENLDDNYINKDITKYGCGVIAISDTLLYLDCNYCGNPKFYTAKKRNKWSLDGSSNTMGIYRYSEINDTTLINFDEYVRYVTHLNQDILKLKKREWDDGTITVNLDLFMGLYIDQYFKENDT